IAAQLERHLDTYKPNMVITMMGINDEMATVEPYRAVFPKEKPSWFETLRVYKLAHLLVASLSRRRNESSRLDESLTIDPEDYHEIISLGKRYAAQGQFDQARKIFERSIEVAPDYHQGYFWLGRMHMLGGMSEYSEAVEMFQKAISLDPGNEQIYVELGWCYRDQGEEDKAEKVFADLIENIAEDNWVYFAYQLDKEEEENQKIEEHIKRYISEHPPNERVYGALGSLYREWKKNTLAEEYFKKAYALRLECYNPVVRRNYQNVKKMLVEKGIQLVCVQYPLRPLAPLRKMLDFSEDVLFVDNEAVFKNALQAEPYSFYFTDFFGGDFGHCTAEGNQLLAQSIADVILAYYRDAYENTSR
ncbi:tetratricopeptide repeat protein, partial [Candidatus Omnitrophota bacterium]